ncbi:MAG: alanyl-tRNA editing protein, partial [Bellilinea sp.]
MTDLLYQTDSYIQEFDALIAAVDADNRAVLLDRSAFYPGGGGQPADSGVLTAGGSTFPVTRAKKGPEGVWHWLGGETPLPTVGSAVHGQIDWQRRYQLMRTHSALHILCGVVFRDYGAQVTGGDMEPLKGRMDFEFENLSKDLVAVIEEAVNR